MTDINKYSNASIYTIRCRTDDSLIYVGSTISPIHKRLCSHKTNCKNGKAGSLYNHIKNDDWSDWYLELYEKYPCNDRAELCKREGEVIREIGTINKCIAGRTMKEYYNEKKHDYKKYYNDNADKKKEYQKEYYQRMRCITP
jgi:hypothetical protein